MTTILDLQTLSRGFGSSCLYKKCKSKNDMAAVTNWAKGCIYNLAILPCLTLVQGGNHLLTLGNPVHSELWAVSEKEITFLEKLSSLFSVRWTISVLRLISSCLISCCIGSEWLLIKKRLSKVPTQTINLGPFSQKKPCLFSQGG